MKKRIFAVALVGLFLACDTVPRHKLTLTFNDAGDRVTIETRTTLPKLKEATNRARVEQLRDALLGGTDEWAIRFKNAAPERDRVSYERTGGDLTEVTRSATIDAIDIQKFFFDLPITAKVTRSNDGIVELALYPGTSNRATREEREELEKSLDEGAHAARRYINAMRVVYEYLDKHPQRAHDVFEAMFHDEDDPQLIVATEREVALIKAVKESMNALLDVDWNSANREADRVINPFPADIFVRLPSAPLLVEGFTNDAEGLYIRPKSLLDALAGLEGRWLYPDPIAVALRSPEMKEKDLVDFFAGTGRRAEPVVGLQEVLAGLTAQLKPAETYRVRFSVRSSRTQ
jgi:hypothetical protein